MLGLNIIFISARTRTSVLAHESFQHNCGLPINATRMRQSLRYKYIQICAFGGIEPPIPRNTIVVFYSSLLHYDIKRTRLTISLRRQYTL